MGVCVKLLFHRIAKFTVKGKCCIGEDHINSTVSDIAKQYLNFWPGGKSTILKNKTFCVFLLYFYPMVRDHDEWPAVFNPTESFSPRKGRRFESELSRPLWLWTVICCYPMSLELRATPRHSNFQGCAYRAPVHIPSLTGLSYIH